MILVILSILFLMGYPVGKALAITCIIGQIAVLLKKCLDNYDPDKN